MKRRFRMRLLRSLALGLAGLAAPVCLLPAQEKAAVSAGGTMNITVTAASAAAPPVSITLNDRHGHVTPSKGKCTHTGGGLIDVASPSADTVIITMSGAVIANSEMKFDLDQCFEISFDDPKVKKAKISMEGRVIGLLRGEKKGSAEYSEACAHLSACTTDIISVCVPPHSVGYCESLAVNDHDGPKTVPVTPGKYTLHQTFAIGAHSDCCLTKRSSAEFAPDPALDPLWISYYDPFHGIKKDTFGFQVIVKVAPDTDDGGDKKGPEAVPAPLPEKKEDGPSKEKP
jgi:hypothetical protein